MLQPFSVERLGNTAEMSAVLALVAWLRGPQVSFKYAVSLYLCSRSPSDLIVQAS